MSRAKRARVVMPAEMLFALDQLAAKVREPSCRAPDRAAVIRALVLFALALDLTGPEVRGLLKRDKVRRGRLPGARVVLYEKTAEKLVRHVSSDIPNSG